MKKQSATTLKITVNEGVSVKENITNRKRWFNGLKEFVSVKVLPPNKK